MGLGAEMKQKEGFPPTVLQMLCALSGIQSKGNSMWDEHQEN